MNLKTESTPKWLEFTLLKQFPEIVHGVFCRQGGFSSAPYNSLNVAYQLGDDEPSVKQNLSLIQDTLELDRIVWANQIHGTACEEVNEESPNIMGSCDALITQENNTGLLIKHADCQATILYDPINRAIGNIHCGWRGNVQNIYATTIQNMIKMYGTRPEDLFVCISPSLGPNNSEFKNYKKELPQSIWKYQIRPGYFDLWTLAMHQLCDIGVRPENIEIARIDTYEDEENYFSFRRDGVTGRNGTIIALREPI
ncbi:MAG: hypothetical protein CMO81_10325 [Waddliaceae bacterium]|nr:hypothetical protein [Waddliaceae bacterium]